MKKKYLPLSDVQRSYLYGRNKNTFLGGVSTHYYIEHLTVLDKDKLEYALNCSIKEQPSLRSYITDNGMQCFMDEVPHCPIREVDLSMLTKEQQEEELAKVRERYANRMFELNKWPMFEFAMYKLNDKESILLIDSDMMIMDGLSTEIFVESLYKFYETDETIKEIPVSAFEQYIEKKEEKAKKNYELDKAFWKEIVEKIPAGPQFEKSKEMEDNTFSTIETVIAKEKWNEVKQVLSSKKIMPSVYLTTAYAKLLSRWCGQSKVTLNMTVSNRKGNIKEILGAMGDFTEVMLVDFDFSDEKSLYDKAAETLRIISERKKHNAVSSSEIIREYTACHGCDNSFPFPAVCTCMLFDVAGSKWEWMGQRRYQVSQTPQIMLDNQISLKDGRLVIHWDYLRAYFNEDKIKCMQEEYCAIIMDETERIQKTYDAYAIEYNNSFHEREKTTLVKAFKENVALYSDKTAVSDPQNSCTYKELDMWSDIIADYIIETCQIGYPIIVKMTRSIQAVVAILGVIKAGGYYIPVSHNCPEQRLAFIIEQSGSTITFTDDNVGEILANRQWKEEIDYSEPEKVAYVIYTSGSTGNPKGVVITHDAVCNTIQNVNEKFKVSSKDTFIGISSFSFDLSVYDIFGSILSGAELTLAPSAYDMHLIKSMIAEGRVTMWNTVPSIMELLVNNIDEAFVDDTLRVVMLSGDWIPLNLPDRIKKHFPNAQIYSLGGATEAAIWSIYYPIQTVEDSWNSIPYGYPLENQSIWILDEKNQICPPGVRGEICIGGRGIAKGYLNDKERTEKQFFKHDKLGDLYRTGDLGLLSKNGWVVFLGRKDFQVKLHGYRIELGEIESCLRQCENVSEVVAQVKEVNGNQRLFAYVTPSKLKETSNYSDSYITKAKSKKYRIKGTTTEEFEQIQKTLDNISLGIMEKVFQGLCVEKEFCIDEMIEKNDIDLKFKKILTQWADSLVQADIFAKAENGVYINTGNSLCTEKMSSIALQEMKDWEDALHFLSSCEENILDVIKGTINSLTLLFKDGKSDIADNLYGSNPVAGYYNNIVAETVESFISNFPENRTVRILEVGAGVGATTKPVLEKIQGREYSYDFTDLSVFFHDIAKEKLSSFKNVSYEILDIDQSILEQGYQPGSYDLIIAANVIHDSHDVEAALKNLRTLLSNDGAVIILEVTKSRHFHKISMGLTDGYSAYTDALRMEQNSPLLRAEQWENVLKEAGYSHISLLNDDTTFEGGQSVITAVANKKYAYPVVSEMFEALRKKVMSYMVPDNIIVMEQFPYTANKKVNRKLLPVIEMSNNETQIYEAPETETEKLLTQVLCEIIQTEKVSVTANLINVGIDSLRGITFITKLQDKGIQIGLSDFYSNPTIRELSQFIDSANDEMEFGEI